MRHRTKLRIPSFSGYYLSEARTNEDFHCIAKLACTIWYEHYPSIISIHQIRYMLKKMYSIKTITSDVKKGVCYFLILHKEKPVGFLSVSLKQKKNLFIHKFYILSSQRGRGLGKAVFKKILRWYNPASVRLTVNRQNYKSINFYFRLGFFIEKVADFPIGNGFYMNDFVMCRMKKT